MPPCRHRYLSNLAVREKRGCCQRCQSRGGHLDPGGRRKVLSTYTGKTKHGGEEQGAAKLGLVGHEIAYEQVCIEQPQDRMVNRQIKRDEPSGQIV